MSQPEVTEVSGQIAGKELRLSTGEFAKQADGSVMVQCGETVVLGTAVMSKPMSPDADFMPLLVDYEEKFYAAGKIKGSRFVKRDGRPADSAILTARLIDRAIRPLFPKGTINDIQIVITVLSYDGENDPSILGMIAAFGALMISDIPWNGSLGAVRVGRVDDALVINPTAEQMEQTTLDLILAGTETDTVMLEAGAHEIVEDVMLDAIEEGQKAIAETIGVLKDLQGKVGKEKREPTLAQGNEEQAEKVQGLADAMLRERLEKAGSKDEIGQAERDTFEDVKKALEEEDEEHGISDKVIGNSIHELHGKIARENILSSDTRSDGRALDEVRSLYARAGVLPRTHGSGLFQRGETQVLTTTTLGGPSDVLFLDTMEKEEKRRYVHYYNFPAFSVGESRPNRGPGRREIGHGALAERALLPVLPEVEDWPYTMMLVSEVLESNGSSSMGSVCGSSLSMMDAGVPLKKPVSGIAMGLMSDDSGTFKILTDIAGIEDEKGDMDFKVAGTADGITALQMDIKVEGLTRDILAQALEQAKAARLHILEAMNAAIAEPRADMSPYAPRIETIRVPAEKIGDLIGPKGKHINEIIEQTGVEIDIDDDGLVSITTNEKEAMEKALSWVKNMTREVVAGEKFEGKVTRIMNFGAFVEIMPNVEGMVHISQFRDERVESVDDVVKVGDMLPVVVSEIDSMGRINLSHKDAVKSPAKSAPSSPDATPSKPFKGPRPPQ